MSKKQNFKMIFELESLFKKYLAQESQLTQVKGPLFVDPATGLNDDLSGIEHPLRFSYQNQIYEIVQSLAKWKRQALADYGFQPYEGLFVEMHAIRPEETTIGKYHDLHVDQYDWEKIILDEDRSRKFLKEEASKIYRAIYLTKNTLQKKYHFLKQSLKPEMTFICSEELLALYPELSAKEREQAITKKYKSVFIVGIGHELSNGKPHDLRAPDYDDWNLNGDILVWDEINQEALELSSMGIRVDHQAILRQHEITSNLEKLNRPFHQKIVNQKLPLTIGGGIGRSRLNMFLLEKNHLQEVK